ncbi:MAG TPA: recombinase family protein [Trebonia sp.]|nr:recombinase family protein [Trebonia sp.]
MFLGRTSTSTMQDPVESLLRQYRQAGERLPEGLYISRCYWDIESGGTELDARSQTSTWRKFTDAGIPRDGGMAEFRAAIAAGQRPAAVICESTSRVSRDMLDSLTLERELKKAGVMILATSEPIDLQAPQSSTILMRRMHMAEAEYFRYNLKTSMWEGLRQYAIGGHNTGPCPYGYAEERTPHPNPMKASMGATRARLIPHPEHAQWVTRMFQWRVTEKLSVPGIARRLTELGVPNPSGGKAWNPGTVNWILRNPKYTGRVVLGRTTNTGPSSRKGERHDVTLPREYWTWADEAHAHEALTDAGTWEAAQAIGQQRGNTPDTGTRRSNAGRLYPYRARIHCNQCHRRMHGIARDDRTATRTYAYYLCPTMMHKPDDKQRYPGHIRASVREDVLTAALSEFIDTRALGHDRAARLARLIPATQAQQDDINDARAAALRTQIKQAGTSLNGIAAEMGRLAGKDDPMTTAIRDRLTAQFAERHDEKTRAETELQAIEDTADLPADDLSLLDELPYAPGLLARAPDDLREKLAAAFDLQCVYRPDMKQATVCLTITDTTPGIITAILNDPRTDSDTGATPPATPPASSGPATSRPAASPNTFADVPPGTIATEITIKCGCRRRGMPAVSLPRPVRGSTGRCRQGTEGRCNPRASVRCRGSCRPSTAGCRDAPLRQSQWPGGHLRRGRLATSASPANRDAALALLARARGTPALHSP